MNIRAYLRLMRRHIVLLAILIVAGAAGGMSIFLAQTPQYTSTGAVFVSVGEVSSAQDLNQATSFTQQVVKSYVDLATSSSVLDPVIAKLKLDTDVQQLSEQLSVAAPLDTVIVQVTATSSSPAGAADLANSVCASLSKQAEFLAPAASSGPALVSVHQIQKAAVPTEPASPRLALQLALGIVLGFLLWGVVVLVREALDIRLRTPDMIEEAIQRPVLGVVPYDEQATGSLAPASERKGSYWEAIRGLRANLRFTAAGKPNAVIVLTSSVPSEGKTTTALSLAYSFMDLGRKVLLVDADMRRPLVAERMGLDGSVGLSDVLSGDVSFEDAQQSVGQAGLTVLPAGAIPPNPAELIESESFQKLFENIRSQFDVVLLDAPPSLAVTDAASAARIGTVLVVAASGRITRQDLTRTSTALALAQADIAGVLVTKARSSRRGDEGYGYTYAYYQTSPQKAL